MLVLFSLLVSANASATWTIEELDSLYPQNAYSVTNLRVQWRFHSQDTDLGNLLQRRWGQELERQLRERIVPKSIVDEYGGQDGIRNYIERTRSIKTNTETRLSQTHDQDFWTDRERFQTRTPFYEVGGRIAWGQPPPPPEFPDDITTPDSLADVFERIRVVSYDHGAGFRTWVGDDGPPLGIISQTNSEQPWFPFPPLAMPRSEWLCEVQPAWDGRWSGICPIDRFFLDSPTHSSVGESIQLDGVSVVPVVKAFADTDRPEFGLVVRAFVDPERGAIPIVMESYAASPTFPGRLTEDFSWLPPQPVTDWSEEPRPNYHLHVSRISEPSPGFFFPAEGEYQLYSTSADFPSLKAGTPLLLEEIPWEVGMRTTWLARDVHANINMPEEMFAFEFPPKTVFRDMVRGENFVVGDLDGHAERIVGGMMQNPDVQQRTSWLYILISAFILLAVATFWIVRQKTT